MLKYRLISAFILIPLTISALFLLTLMKFSIITLIICIIAMWEWSGLINAVSCHKRIYLTIFFGLILFLVLFFLKENHFNVYHPLITSSLWLSLIWWFSAIFLVIFYPISGKIWRKSLILHFIFGFFIIEPFFIGIIILRSWNYDVNYYSGAIRLMYIMILIWGADSGSYIFGKLLGRHKFIFKVSPEKTWQGFFGGFFTAIIIAYNYSIYINFETTPSRFLIFSLLAELASVIGDLTESMFKREVGIKDSSCLIPGHGGMLDRIDSLTAAVPVFVWLLLEFKTV